jgi:hypothetical protein
MQGPYRLGTLIRVEDVGRTRYIDDALSPMYWSGQMVKYDLPKGVSVCTKLPKLPMKPPHVDNPNPHQISTESVDVRFEAIHIGIKRNDDTGKTHLVRVPVMPYMTRRKDVKNGIIYFELSTPFDVRGKFRFTRKIYADYHLRGSVRLAAQACLMTGIVKAEFEEKKIEVVSADFRPDSYVIDFKAYNLAATRKNYGKNH